MAFTRGHLRLENWMKRTKSAQADVAKIACRSEAAVSLWMRRGSRPDGDARLKLKKIVPPEAWSEPAE